MFKKTCALVLTLALSISALSVAPDADAAAKKPKKITLNASKKTLTAGQKFTLKVKKVKPAKANKKVTWKSSKKSVATVSSKGVVKAKKAGKATITATSKKNKKVKATCKITVKNSSTTPKPSPTPTATQQTSTEVPTPTETPTAPPTESPTPTPKPNSTEKPTPTPTPEMEYLKDVADFDVGTVVNPERLEDPDFCELVKSHFNLVSFENQMKGEALLDVDGCQEAVAETGDETAVVCKFDQADKMVEWARDNGLRVRGHVLVWEAQMKEAFFYKGYAKEILDEEGNVVGQGELVDAETLKARLHNYAMEVIPHFEEKYPGTVIAWDVVNEAINTEGPADAETGLHLIQSYKLYQILGAEYLRIAFQCAKDAVKATGADISLFYNDYNTFQAPKTAYIEALIDYLNADPDNKLLDCMGMEGYVLMGWPSASDILGAMNKFAKKGVKVGITELTVRLNPDYAANGKEVTEKDLANHAKRYKDVFTQYCVFNQRTPDTLTGVSIWGLLDRPDLLPEKDKPSNERHYDYGIYGTHSGLFTENYVAKQSYWNVLEVLKKYKKN